MEMETGRDGAGQVLGVGGLELPVRLLFMSRFSYGTA